MTGADPPSRAPHTLFTFNSHEDLRMYATGCDADIGGNSTPRPTLFGDILDNIEFHEYLALRLRVSGDPITHNSYFVNLQTNGPITTDVWQHRLFFRRKDEWEDVFIPFRNFVRTNNGELSEIQLEMSPHLRSVGISLLGGNSAVSGKYQLNIDSIRIVNEEDAVSDLDSSGTDEKEEKGQTWEDIKI
ncbi:hypothetical protein HHX47_DHR7000688 [Lentinula edodes]|nr:hypothetical protein HHX47_DHR7000688 [Lentinula edodes]